ncbi:MAG: hypothetical protein WAN50_00195 [Minisyncoccia bacterium]
MPTLEPSKLRIRTLELLRNRPIQLTLDKIAAATGIKVAWLQYFQAQGDETSPSVDRIETLYNFLSSKKLTVL